ncbi:uncharacterized protein LOC62_03G005158 [Vanrija pseudolonga]|uniref:F-box domain-containing protein n=1 Tax=Vanrija pseudolonga TaxID=143232 RepID=A0AAF0Y7R6_9TREE|nr:hypothetical protein LOC62_03G005158 [Vanrija pseudolonga]
MSLFPRVAVPAAPTAAHTGATTTTQRTPSDPLASLGVDIFLNIADQMNTVELVTASQVCKAWRGTLLSSTESWRRACRRSKVEQGEPPIPNVGGWDDFGLTHKIAIVHARIEQAWETRPRTALERRPFPSPTHVQVDSVSGTILACAGNQWTIYDSCSLERLVTFNVSNAPRHHIGLCNGVLVYPALRPPEDGFPAYWTFFIVKVERDHPNPLLRPVQLLPDTAGVMSRPDGAWGGWTLAAGGWAQPPWFVCAQEEALSTHLYVRSWDGDKLGPAVRYTHTLRHVQPFLHLRLPIFQQGHHMFLYQDRAVVYRHPPEDSPNDPCRRIATWPPPTGPLTSMAFQINKAIYNKDGLCILTRFASSVSVRGVRAGSVGFQVAMGNKTGTARGAKLACHNDRDLIVAVWRTCVLVLMGFHATTAHLLTLPDAERASYLAKRTVLLEFQHYVKDITTYGDRFAVALSDGNIVIVDSRKIAAAVASPQAELRCLVLSDLYTPRDSNILHNDGGRVNSKLLMDARALYIVDHRQNKLTAYKFF